MRDKTKRWKNVFLNNSYHTIEKKTDVMIYKDLYSLE